MPADSILHERFQVALNEPLSRGSAPLIKNPMTAESLVTPYPRNVLPFHFEAREDKGGMGG